jgi:hypothetical protein
MAYADLVALDERTVVESIPFSQVDFRLQETDNGNRLFARFGDLDVNVRNSERQFEVICQAFDVPRPFAERVSPSLLGEMFREMANNKDREARNNWMIDTDSGELISFGDPRKPYIPYSRVGSILENKGMELKGDLIRHGDAEIVGLHQHQGRVEPRVGDVTLSGINIKFNPLMDNPPEVLPWSERLVCTNGMTSTNNRERVRVVGHDVDFVLEQIDGLADRMMQEAERLNHGFADMAGQEVNDPAAAMRNFIIANRIPARLHQNLIELAQGLETPTTMYDILNIYTQMATHTFEPDNRRRLQAIGGHVALTNHLNCSTCGHELQ